VYAFEHFQDGMIANSRVNVTNPNDSIAYPSICQKWGEERLRPIVVVDVDFPPILAGPNDTLRLNRTTMLSTTYRPEKRRTMA